MKTDNDASETFVYQLMLVFGGSGSLDLSVRTHSSSLLRQNESNCFLSTVAKWPWVLLAGLSGLLESVLDWLCCSSDELCTSVLASSFQRNTEFHTTTFMQIQSIREIMGDSNVIIDSVPFMAATINTTAAQLATSSDYNDVFLWATYEGRSVNMTSVVNRDSVNSFWMFLGKAVDLMWGRHIIDFLL